MGLCGSKEASADTNLKRQNALPKKQADGATATAAAGAVWPPPPPIGAGDAASNFLTAFAHAAEPALKLGLGELVLNWDQQGGLFLRNAPSDDPSFEIHVVDKGTVEDKEKPHNKKHALKPGDICKRLDMEVASVSMPARPYPWLPPEYEEFPEQVVIFDVTTNVHITMNDNIGLQLRSNAWWSGLIDQVAMGDIHIKTSFRVYFNTPTMYVIMAPYGEPIVKWDVDVALFPWQWQVPEVVVNNWFPNALKWKIMEYTYQNPIKFSFAGPGKVSYLMRLGVETGAQDADGEEENKSWF